MTLLLASSLSRAVGGRIGLSDSEIIAKYLGGMEEAKKHAFTLNQLRAFIDTLGGQWFTGKLANKAVSAMTSAQNPHGGQEATILGLYTTFMHWGSVIVAPGYTDQALFATGGNPYGYSHTQGAEFDDKAKASIGHQAKQIGRAHV